MLWGGGEWVAIVVVVCGKNWCGSRYEHCDYDSGDKKTKKQKCKKTKRQKY